MTNRELIFAIQDLCKNISDDTLINEEHILFIANEIRAVLLQQKYKTIKLQVAESNYQSIELDLVVNGESECTKPTSVCGNTNFLTSFYRIPKLMEIGNTNITPVNFYSGVNICFVSRERMRFVGENPILKNIIYVSINPDGKLQFKSANPQFIHLKKVRLTGVFDDFIAASELDCNADCEVWDRIFPLEEALTSTLIDTAVKIVTGSLYKPADIQNNANDDLANLSAFIRNNVKQGLQQQIEG